MVVPARRVAVTRRATAPAAAAGRPQTVGMGPQPGAAEAWPAWATEPVRIVAPDPAWATRGAAASAWLGGVLAPWLVAGVHHVGSTAVPGLAAKPILDLMAGVRDLAAAPDVAAFLAPRAWHLVPPELDARAWRRLLVQVQDDRRVAHLLLVRPGHPRWTEMLHFRDRLRGDADLAARYARLKRASAAAHPRDREAYTARKTSFVQEILNQAATGS